MNQAEGYKEREKQFKRKAQALEVVAERHTSEFCCGTRREPAVTVTEGITAAISNARSCRCSKPAKKSEATAAAGTVVYGELYLREANTATGCSKNHKNPFPGTPNQG